MDFVTFVIAGPATITNTVAQIFGGAQTGGATTLGAGINVNEVGVCQTDVFTVSNSLVPPVCGTLTGDHSKYKQIWCSCNLVS